MKSYLLLYKGPATPPDASHEGWPEWFDSIGSALVSQGSPMTDRAAISGDESQAVDVSSMNGYSIIKAEGMDEALELVADHPYLKLGDDHAIEIFEVPKLD